MRAKMPKSDPPPPGVSGAIAGLAYSASGGPEQGLEHDNIIVTETPDPGLDLT